MKIKGKLECAIENCFRRGTDACMKCKHNHARNVQVDGFEACEDKDPAEYRKRNGRYLTRQIGSAEHGGLQCPACGCLKNAYTFNEENNYECDGCGLPLTVKG